ncbi:MAG: hypothetical protein LBK02_02625, partial [Treponema sp.]|nr:hypothetical protein [Treponema sp.]
PPAQPGAKNEDSNDCPKLLHAILRPILRVTLSRDAAGVSCAAIFLQFSMINILFSPIFRHASGILLIIGCFDPMLGGKQA